MQMWVLQTWIKALGIYIVMKGQMKAFFNTFDQHILTHEVLKRVNSSRPSDAYMHQ